MDKDTTPTTTITSTAAATPTTTTTTATPTTTTTTTTTTTSTHKKKFKIFHKQQQQQQQQQQQNINNSRLQLLQNDEVMSARSQLTFNSPTIPETFLQDTTTTTATPTTTTTATTTTTTAATTKDSVANGVNNGVKVVKSRSRRGGVRCLRGVIVVLTAVIAALVTYIIIDKLYSTTTITTTTTTTTTTTCTTPACLRAASRLLDRMDRSVSPCDDFYTFACGNYLNDNVVPDDALYRSAMQEMEEEVLVIIKKMLESPSRVNETEAFGKAKRLYHSCMNTSFTVHEKDMADSPIFTLLSPDYLGAWPIVSGGFDATHFNLEDTLAKLALHQIHTFFEFYITPDEKNSSVYTLQFYKGTPALARNYYLNTTNEDYVGYISAYRALLEETTLALSPKHGINTSHIDELIAFETKFATISDSRECDGEGNMTEILEMYESSQRLTVAELEVMEPQIAWTRMLRHTLSEFNIDLEVESLVLTIHCTPYLPDLIKLINDTPDRVIMNYLLWRFVLRYLPYISNYFQQLWQQFRSEVPDPTEQRTYMSRWKECASVVNEGFGAALARRYVEEYYDHSISKKIDELVEEVRTAFQIVIERQDWLEEEMKQVCSEKLDMMGKKIGYPEYIEKTELLDQEFEGLEILEDHFLNNILRMKKHEVWKELQKLSRPVDKKRDWLIQPLVVNAFHNPAANEIILPLGILREPFYNPGYPMYLNYGSLGVVIGHELVHGFDNHGKRYDKHGNVSQWWSEEMAEKFTERASCFVEQYSQFPIDMVGKNVDGNETLGDNICDNAGVLNAWLAYTRHSATVPGGGPVPFQEPTLPGLNYTIPQIFFITFAQIWCEVVSKKGYEKYSKDIHSPGVYRANVVVQNSHLFADTWHCPPGTPMNPEKKCHLWV